MSKDHLGLLVIILIALALRLALLGEQSLWYDEGVTWLLSQKSPADLIRWTAADIQPPLYYLLIWETDALFGPGEWALRFPSVIFGVLTVPLIYVLARYLFLASPENLRASSPRRLASAPHLAAALLAISPVMVYYAQEARMYTLLVFEATLASYLLLKILYPTPLVHTDSPSSFSLHPTVFLYALTAAAALYTHYFAAFLLIAHGLYSLFSLWRRGFPKVLWLQLLQVFGIITLLFVPWFWILLARLGDNPSYWPGALKLHEALRKVLISFTAGETVLEQTGLWLALGYLLLLIIGFISVQVRESEQRCSDPSSILYLPSSIFLFLWLCLPITFILILSYQSPKFNPRYTLLAWPAFALLVAAALAQFDLGRFSLNNLRSTLHALTFTLFYALILATSVFSLYNWFTDPRFAKDDFQALAQFVRERSAPGETVLLSSGHMYPVWAYYYGWQGWTPLPRLERLDINRTTDLSISAEMAEALQNKSGVWLVSWQDEVIDPNGVVPFWLDRVGERPHDAGDFQGVRLEHWRLDPDKITLLHENPIERPLLRTSWPDSANVSPDHSENGAVTETGYNFANQVELVGVTHLGDTDLALFWRPRRPLPDDLLLTLRLTDRDGFDWDRHPFVGRPGAYLYPPSRWPVGQLVMTRHHLDWQAGTPPGLYWIEVGLGLPAADNAAAGFSGWDILDEQGRPQRRTGLIDAINLSRVVRPGNDSLPLAEPPLVDFSPIITLHYSELSQPSAEPGDRVLLKLLWQAGQFNYDDISVAFDLIDSRQQSYRIGSSLTPSRNFNLPRWKPGDIVLGQYWLNIPPEAAPGPAELQVHLVNVHGFFYDEHFPFSWLEILPTTRNFTPPAEVDMPLKADFSGRTTLIGADCRLSTSSSDDGASQAACRAAPGETVTLTLYWRADSRMDINYTVFTHLLGPGETVVVNADHAPAKPTQGWVPGEIIADSVTLTLPADLSPGNYAIEVGLYNAADPAFPRLSLTTGDTRIILPQPVKIEQ
jgi:mannosyltransferase